MKASYEGFYRRCSRYRVVRCACWSCLRVLRLLRVVFPKNLGGLLKGRNLSLARLAVFHFVFFLFLVGLNINPTKALADTYIGGPYTNANDAGLSYLGYDYDNLVDETKHTALNELVEFPDRYPDYTSWIDTFYAEVFDARYYWSRVDGMLFVDMVDKARADVKKAEKAAEDYNNSQDDDYVTFYGYPKYVNNINSRWPYFIDTSENKFSLDIASSYTLMPSPITVKVKASGDFKTFLENYKVTDYKYYCFINNYRSNDYINTFQIFAFSNANSNMNINEIGVIGTEYIDSVTFNPSYSFISMTNVSYTYAGGIITIDPTGLVGTIANITGTSFTPNSGAIFLERGNGEAGPENPNPDPEPEAPTALPETPTAPDLPDPDLPTEPVVPDSPDLSDLLRALDEHCQHIQLAIYNGLDDYYKSITKYYEDVTKWLADTYKYYDNELDKRFQVLSNYLRSTNQYLKNIDDNVQEILDKLDDLGEQIGLGDIPDSYDNNNVATNGSSALSNAYNTIRNKFPFSVFDNLLTLVTSLNHDAVAPVVSLPVGNPFGSEPYMVEMDFTDWSDLAAIVRTGELVVAYLGMSKSAIRMWTGGEGEPE